MKQSGTATGKTPLALHFRRALWSIVVTAVLSTGTVTGLAAYDVAGGAPPAFAGVNRTTAASVANLEVGYVATPGQCQKYGPLCADWCAMFATWVWERAGVVGAPRATYVATAIGQWGLNRGLFKRRPPGGIGQPLPGDIVVYGEPGSGTGGHVSIVYSVNSNGTLTTIDGNWNNSVTRRTINPLTARAGSRNVLISGYVSPPGAGGTVSDFSGDWHADVLGVDSSGVLWYYPNNRLTLPSRHQLGSGWASFRHAKAADFSGDGYADVLGVDSGGALWYYPNNGLALGSRHQLGSGWQYMSHFMAADFSGDGYADVLAVDGNGDFWYYPNNGLSLGARRQIGMGFRDFSHVVAGDFSGDGFADVLGVDSGGQLWHYPNNGLSLSSRHWLGSGWQSFRFVRAMDFSGDGFADVLGVDGAGQLWYYPNNGLSLSSRQQLGSGWGSFRFIF